MNDIDKTRSARLMVALRKFCFTPAIWICGAVALSGIGATDVSAQDSVYSFTTSAGLSGYPGYQDGATTNALFFFPSGVSVDQSNNVYVADTVNCAIRKIAPDGTVMTLAGINTPGSIDGYGTAARFNYPTGIASDGAGVLYVADSGNNTIRKVEQVVKGRVLVGYVTLLAGSSTISGSADGTGTGARFNYPAGLAVDSLNRIFVADRNNHTVRMITSGGVVTTLAGLAGNSGAKDGVGSLARFKNPAGVAVDNWGNVYVADTGNHVIRKIVVQTGAVTTLAGLPGSPGNQDGVGSLARFSSPASLAVTGNGTLLVVADTGNHLIRMITPAGKVSTAAGLAGSSYSQDGVGTTALFLGPQGVALDSSGNAYVSDADQAIHSGTLVLIIPPSIAVQPQSLTNLAGSTAIFSVQVTNTPVFACQWFLNDTNMPGETAATLTLANIQSSDAGQYSVVISNSTGSVTSDVAFLDVTPASPVITSATSRSGKQGASFNYAIMASGSEPFTYDAQGLPSGLTFDPVSGMISGAPIDSGIFPVTIGVTNSFGADVQTLVLTIASSIPTITSASTKTGKEEQALTYTIKASDSPANFGAVNLPLGLTVNPTNGVIQGASVYAGEFDAWIWAQNQWGTGSNSLHFSIGTTPVQGLVITGLGKPVYSAPYLLDFEFSLRDSADPSTSHSVLRTPSQVAVKCYEDTVGVSPTETACLLQSAGMRPVKSYMVLDYSASMEIGSPDTDGNGVSDAIESMQQSAKTFIAQQSVDTQFGIYEFNADDIDPAEVTTNGFTSDKQALYKDIDGILPNYVQSYYAGTRCWDAVYAALGKFTSTNTDEQRFLVIMTDGNDDSSYVAGTNSADCVSSIIALAITNRVKLYCVAFGADINTNVLSELTTQTSGRYYVAATAADLATQFAQLGKDVQGIYLLRWATLNRTGTAFQPAFQITVDGITASTNMGIIALPLVELDTNKPPEIITNEDLTTITNFFYITNTPAIPDYVAKDHAGDVRVGTLRLSPDALSNPRAVTLRTVYTPRYVRTVRVHYQPNFPCIPQLLSTNAGEILYGWSLSETNDGAGGKWLSITSPNQSSLQTSIPYGAMGNLISFNFRDLPSSSNAFSFFNVDNTVYTNVPPVGESFILETNFAFTVYPALPHGTPVPWLTANGFTGDLAAAELSDPDQDGEPTWMEYLAGTDPRKADSVFKIQSLNRANVYVPYKVYFSTVAGRTYRVEFSSDLITWHVLQDNVQGVGGEMAVPDNINSPNLPSQFYRVIAY